MKLTLLLFMCFVSITWQQNAFWPQHSSWRMPLYSPNLLAAFDSNAAFEPRQQHYQHFLEDQKRLDEGDIEASLTRTTYQRPKTNTNSRAFGLGGLLGINYLANLILNSFSFTSTTFVTSTSTVTAGTIVTCYNSAIFLTSTVACRRKRKAIHSDILIGDHDGVDTVEAHREEALNGTNGNIERLPREGRDIQMARLIVSSLNDRMALMSQKHQSESSVSRYLRQNRPTLQRNFEATTVTSTITTFSLYVTSSTKSIYKDFAADKALTCLPSGFTLCPK